MSSPTCAIGAPLQPPPPAAAPAAPAQPPAQFDTPQPLTLGRALCRLYAGLVFLR
ncbi:hypothetical protein [Pseudoduganella chitinolytica]|uniref:Uncharacterized protein n=1 Tax=Pseudoduganella chitinolytica TaxID=34070 RepID=A0ABY8BFN9_9BURK|nr:hypothetical protein [Pseudoduganella chitinolytica]WEF34496.1 hypothetical protein PX653_06940 [Pseudoduganella chitinolytica]